MHMQIWTPARPAIKGVIEALPRLEEPLNSLQNDQSRRHSWAVMILVKKKILHLLTLMLASKAVLWGDSPVGSWSLLPPIHVSAL